MKNPKKNQKKPFTRRQFMGSCAAGASMISLAPYLSLVGCKHPQDRFPQEKCELVEFPNKHGKSGTRPIIHLNYDGKISLDITFPGYMICKKKIKFEKGTKVFNYINIESLGWMAFSGRPELPYLGMLIHIPNFLDFDPPKVEVPASLTQVIKAPGNIYPSQIKLMDNKNFKDNHGHPEYDEKFYMNPPKYYPRDVVGETDIIHFGYSRFLILKVYPYTWLPNEDEAKFHTNVLIDISLSPKTKMIPKYYYETPFINKTFELLPPELRIENPVPEFERIIDPWGDNEKVKGILGETPVLKKFYKNNNYKKFGKEQLIIYNDDKDAQLEGPVKKLFEFKKRQEITVELKKKSELGENVYTYLRGLRQPLVSGDTIEYSNIKDVILFGDFGKGEKAPRAKSEEYTPEGTINDFAEHRSREIYFNLPTTMGTEDATEPYNLTKDFYTDYYGGTLRLPEPDEILIPDINVGRIPARNEDEGYIIVDNIIEYVDKRYEVRDRLTLAGYFQDSGKERLKPDGVASTDYIQTLEAIRSGVGESACISTFYQIQKSKNNRPKLYYRNKLEVGNDVEFMNDKECVRGFLESFRNGENIVVHRDHGWMDGWSRPTIKIPDLWKLADTKCNGPKERPSIVFNINCLSGHYMGEETSSPPDLPDKANNCFSEALLKGTISPNYGRINLKCPAVIAAVMESPTFHNDWFVKAMFEKIYGNILSEEPNTEKSKLGDVLKFGRLLLFAYIENNSLSIYDCEIYHILGDPSIKL